MSRSFKHFEWPDDYYIWLCDMIDLETHSRYSNLISFLYNTEFVWSVAKDNNRAGDGKYLRQDYIYEYYYDEGEWLDEPCSLLEMLIALARRVRVDILPEFDMDTSDWFWIFMSHFGFDKYDNEHFSEDKFCACFLVKNLQKGKNLLFSSKKFSETENFDMEIWSQLQFWLAENYDF